MLFNPASGKTELKDWKEIRTYPGPWAELEVPNQIIFTVQSSAIRDYDDPESFLIEYEKIMHDVNYMSGMDGNFRYRAERIVMDKQIKSGSTFFLVVPGRYYRFTITFLAGWMHSGYPIMGLMSYTKSMLNVKSLRKGEKWGEFHEIGHNAQHTSYTISRLTEVGCNLWAYHANLEVSYGWGRINLFNLGATENNAKSCHQTERRVLYLVVVNKGYSIVKNSV